jgi:hypothetical protein
VGKRGDTKQVKKKSRIKQIKNGKRECRKLWVVLYNVNRGSRIAGENRRRKRAGKNKRQKAGSEYEP